MTTNSIREHIRQTLAAAVEAERERLRAKDANDEEHRRRIEPMEARRLENFSPLVVTFESLAAEVASIEGVVVEVSPLRDRVDIKIGMDVTGLTGCVYLVTPNPFGDPDSSEEGYNKFRVNEFKGTRGLGWQMNDEYKFNTREDTFQFVVERIAAHVASQGR